MNVKRGDGTTDWATLMNWSGEMGALTEKHWWIEAGRWEHWLSNTDELKRGDGSTEDEATLMNMKRGDGSTDDEATLMMWSGEVGSLIEQHWWIEVGRCKKKSVVFLLLMIIMMMLNLRVLTTGRSFVDYLLHYESATVYPTCTNQNNTNNRCSSCSDGKNI